MKSLMLFIALSMSLLIQLSPSSAAEIEPVENHPMGCEYKLSGLINNGDAEKIDKVLKENDWFEVAERGWKICLDSPGGSFVEGVKLAKTFAENSIGTVVAQNNVCESACAIAFMGGSYFNPEGENRYVSRTMHPTAKLGFHAPALLIPEGSYSKSEVDKAYEIALKAVVELSDMRSSGYEIRESLFKNTLETPFESMHYVDTVGKALRYKVDVSYVGISSGTVQNITNNICKNAILRIEDNEGIWNHSVFKFTLVAGNIIAKSTDGYYEEASYPCEIEIGDIHFSVSFGGRAAITMPYFSSFGTNDLLKEIFDKQSLTKRELEEKVMKNGLSKKFIPDSCYVTASRAEITNVQNYTNLRRQAGLNGQVIGQVPLGAQVSVINPGNFLRTDRCAAACNGTNQDAIKQCIDNNDVWIEIQYNGRRGFLSRKFLE